MPVCRISGTKPNISDNRDFTLAPFAEEKKYYFNSLSKVIFLAFFILEAFSDVISVPLKWYNFFDRVENILGKRKNAGLGYV